MPKIIANNPDPAVAEANRSVIETGVRYGRTIKLPAGDVYFDRSPRLGSGTLAGAGMGRTTLRLLPGTPGQRTLLVEGAAAGYADPWASADGAAVTMPPTDVFGRPFDPKNFAAGRVVWAFAWNSYFGGIPTRRQRLVVQKLSKLKRAVLFDKDVDQTLDRLKWCDGSPALDIEPGDTNVHLENPDDALLFAPGQLVAGSGGPELANEILLDYRRVVAVDAIDHVVTVDRPFTRFHTQAALVRVAAASDLTVADLTVADPGNGNEPLFVKFASGLKFEGVRFGVPGESNHGPSIISSADVVFDGCENLGQTGLNSSHDVTFRGCRLGGMSGLVCEEGCQDVTVQDAAVAGVNGQHGIAAFPCDRLTLRRVAVSGYGYQGGYPLICGGKDARVEDVTLSGTNPATAARLGGGGLTVVRLSSDVPVSVEQAADASVRGSVAPSWTGLAQTQE